LAGAFVTRVDARTGAAVNVSTGITVAPASDVSSFAFGAIVCGSTHVVMYTADDDLQDGKDFDVFVVTDVVQGSSKTVVWNASDHNLFVYPNLMACESASTILLSDAGSSGSNPGNVWRLDWTSGAITTVVDSFSPAIDDAASVVFNADGSEMLASFWSVESQQENMTACSSTVTVFETATGQPSASTIALPCSTAAGQDWIVFPQRILGGAGSRVFDAVLATPMATCHSPGGQPPTCWWSASAPYAFSTIDISQQPPVVKKSFPLGKQTTLALTSQSATLIECGNFLVVAVFPQVVVTDLVTQYETVYNVPFGDLSSLFVSHPACFHN